MVDRSGGSCRPTEDVIGEIVAIASGWSWGCGPNVILLGCEAFAHPDLIDIVNAAVQAGVERLSVRTNGASLGEPGVAEQFVRAGVNHVEVTLLSGSAGTHDRLVGLPGAFDAAVAGMRAYRAASDSLGIATTLSGRILACEHNITELPDIVREFAEVGVSVVTIDASRAGRRAHVPWLQAAALTGVLNAVWVSIEGVDPAALGESSTHAIAATTTREV